MRTIPMSLLICKRQHKCGGVRCREGSCSTTHYPSQHHYQQQQQQQITTTTTTTTKQNNKTIVRFRNFRQQRLLLHTQYIEATFDEERQEEAEEAAQYSTRGI
jgi:hypothetical protein